MIMRNILMIIQIKMTLIILVITIIKAMIRKVIMIID